MGSDGKSSPRLLGWAGALATTGMEMLRRFILTFDAVVGCPIEPNASYSLEPNASYSQPVPALSR